ncbi:hypothetical protein NL518_27985, partial [Klebsiella pneumoniae]|nr:hypothetical protein [Klebsiella pneumoniae]
IVIINYGSWLFAATVVALALVAWHEFFTMMQAKDIQIQYNIGLIGIILASGCAWLGNTQELVMVMLLVVLVTMAQTILKYKTFGVTEAAFT